MAVMTVREAWDAIARAETEALGDHLTFASIEPILTALAALPLSGERGPQEWQPILRKLIADAWYQGRASTELLPMATATGPQLQDFCERAIQRGLSPLTDAPQTT